MKKVFLAVLCLFVAAVFAATPVMSDGDGANDTAAPEAIVVFDPDTMDFAVYATDNMDPDPDIYCVKSRSGPPKKGKKKGKPGKFFRKKCTLTDASGNTLEVYMQQSVWKKKYGIKTGVTITGIRYNGSSIKIPELHRLSVRAKKDLGFLRERLWWNMPNFNFPHPMEILRATTFYSSRLDKTKVTEWSPFNSYRQAGMALIRLKTDNGEVTYDIV